VLQCIRFFLVACLVVLVLKQRVVELERGKHIHVGKREASLNFLVHLFLCNGGCKRGVR